MLCAILYRDDLADYKDYEDYFYSRNNCFFVIRAICFGGETINTALKGRHYFLYQGKEYYLRIIVHIVLCLEVIKVQNNVFHAVLVALFIVCELSFIFRLFDME
ncbi:hypothetical protein [Flavobacterium sp. ABG]|uniref:hypothetical protein n=1 Tax=Flavobacterium sp. ABG TaxID=1423322 RepID=UPI00103D6A5D|nr:hypothetical protein [Flavobacterium sp. ABG]